MAMTDVGPASRWRRTPRTPEGSEDLGRVAPGLDVDASHGSASRNRVVNRCIRPELSPHAPTEGNRTLVLTVTDLTRFAA